MKLYLIHCFDFYLSWDSIGIPLLGSTSLFATLALLLPLGVPGWAMAVTAIFVAPVCVTLAVYAALAVSARAERARAAADR